MYSLGELIQFSVFNYRYAKYFLIQIQISRSNLLPELQNCTSNCFLDISTWLSKSYRKLTTARRKFLIPPTPNSEPKAFPVFLHSNYLKVMLSLPLSPSFPSEFQPSFCSLSTKSSFLPQDICTTSSLWLECNSFYPSKAGSLSSFRSQVIPSWQTHYPSNSNCYPVICFHITV